MVMKNIILVLSLLLTIPAYSMNREPLFKEEEQPRKKRRARARQLLIINNTLKRHTVRTDHHRYSIDLLSSRDITTHSKSITVDGIERKLDPNKKRICLGAEPKNWSE
jgi:hypothetical protein